MNSNVNDLFKITYEDYIDYLIASHEKELFEAYPYPDIEFTFIFSNSFKTSAVKKISQNGQSSRTKEETLKAAAGDQSIHAISSIYPGLNWLLLSLKDPSKHPYKKGIHFIEYCSQLERKNNMNDSFIHGQNQYIPLECECMGKAFDKHNEKAAEDCNHAAMINDSFLVRTLSDIITTGDKGKIYEAKEQSFVELFKQKFSDEMFCGNYRDLYADNENYKNNKKKNMNTKSRDEDDSTEATGNGFGADTGFSLSNILNLFK